MDRSLYKKTLLIIVVTVVLVSTGAILYFVGTISRLQDQQYEKKAREFADIVALYLDKDVLESFKSQVQEAYSRAQNHISNEEMESDEYKEYIEQFGYLENTEDFRELYKVLRGLEDVVEVDCFYLCYVDEATRAVVYLVDAGDSNVCHPGSFDYLVGEDLKVLSTPDMSIVTTVTNQETYGDIVGSAQPILDDSGNVVAYVGVDISMSHITRQLNRLSLNIVLSVVALALLLTAVSLFISGQLMIKPLNKHQVLLAESENLKKENITLARKALAAEKIAQLTGSISSLLTNMPAMTFSKDVENGRYVACNQMFAEYAHKSNPSQVVGLTDSELFDSATAEHFKEDDLLALSKDEPYIFRENVRDAQGNIRYLQTTKLKFTDANGRLCLLGMSVDISELVMVKKENAETRDAYNQVVSQSLTYSRIARALSSDYSFLYYVDIETDSFIEYSAADGMLDILTEREGEDFFGQTNKDAHDAIYAEDLERFLKTFSKENILKSVEEKGRFLITYRLMLNGKPVYVNLKAVRLEDDEKHIIIGVSDVDAQMKEKEAAERMKEEQTTYERIAALSGQFICIYTVDPETDHFLEYSTTGTYRSLVLPKEGEDFFVKTRMETNRIVYDEDRQRCMEALTRENILECISKAGIFSLKYRLIIDGEPRYVSFSAAIVEEKDGPKIVVGVSDIDTREKVYQEYEKNLASARTKANYDVMTGVKSKHAYVEMEKEQNEKIEAGESESFAIAVCDVNGLKQVNDTLGHKAGDELIKNAAVLISEIFMGAEVFRIGGDEFAAVLTGSAVKDLGDMMWKMKETAVQNREQGGVVVACGMALYDEGDSTVEDVFQRADRAMYKNKEWLKSKVSENEMV